MNEGTMRYARALGWAALGAAPILLATLAVISSGREVSEPTVTLAAIASWVAGALAFGGALVGQRNRRAARIAGALAGTVVASFCAFLAWTASEHRVAALDERERADLEAMNARFVHPHLSFSVPREDALAPAPEIEREAVRAGGEAWARAHRVWAWRGDATEIVLDLSRAPSASREALREASDAIAAELAPPDARVTRSGDGPSTTLRAELAGGAAAIARVTLFEHDGRAYRLVATAITAEPERWRAWLDGISIPRE